MITVYGVRVQMLVHLSLVDLSLFMVIASCRPRERIVDLHIIILWVIDLLSSKILCIQSA
jgi:hypothetical protein